MDAVVLVDGGSDSLMRGDEQGLGDPIEDAVSVTAVAELEGLRHKTLISVGLGCDRFNHVSDAASLRAVAELTRAGGFLGGLCLEPTSPGSRFYRACLKHIYEGHGRYGFRSVLAGSIAAATEGWFGSDAVPPMLTSRVHPGQAFLWPLMAMLWAFDVDAVAERSLIADWIRDSEIVLQAHAELAYGREKLQVRGVENLPLHQDMRR